MATAQQTQRVYAMGAALGLVESGHKDDLLHTLVEALTGQTSVRQLTTEQYKKVIAELAGQIKAANLTPPTPHKAKRQKKYEETPGGITSGQQKKVWALMYQLQGCDKEVGSASLGERLCAIIKRELNIDATPKAPLKWLKYKQGSRLIEALKGYCGSAERARMRGS